MSQEKKTITINNKEYEIDSLSENVKSLLVVHSAWTQDREKAIKDMNDAKLELAKIEAALRDLSKEIVETVEAPAKEQA